MSITMSYTPYDILIFGATGVIGKYITAEIVDAKSSFGKIAIFTTQNTIDSKPDEISALKAKGVEVIIGNIDSEQDVNRAYQNYDTVISAVGRNVIAKQIDLLRLAEASGTIQWFFPSEYGTDIEYSPESAAEIPHQQKLKVRAYIREHVKRLDITYIVTGPYSDMTLGYSPAMNQGGGFDPTTFKAVLFGTGDEPVSYTSMKDTGVLFVAALTHPETSRNKTLKVNSFTCTGHDVLKEYERQTSKKWEVKYIGLEELRVREKEAWEGKNPIATIFTLRRIWTEGGTLYTKRDNRLIGEPRMETLEEQVRLLIKQAKEAVDELGDGVNKVKARM